MESNGKETHVVTVIVLIYNTDSECVQLFDHGGNMFMEDDNNLEMGEFLDGLLKK